MSDQITPTITQIDKARVVASAVQDIAAVVGSPTKETALVAAKQALTSVGTALITLGIVAPGVWSIVSVVAGAVLAASGSVWHLIDDRRAAHAVSDALEDTGLARKIATINDAFPPEKKSGPFIGLFSFVLIGGLGAGLFGCAHVSTIPLDNLPRLMQRDDFAAAQQAAPRWAREALLTIAQLEYEVEKAAPFGVTVADTATIPDNR